MLIKIKKIIQTNPNSFNRILKSKSNSLLLDFIFKKTSQLNANHTLKTRLFWILNNINDWTDERVSCKVCGKPLINHNVVNLKKGFKSTCSKKCSRILAQKSNIETCLKKYGCKNIFQTKQIKENLKIRNNDIQNKKKQTKLRHFGNPNFNNSQKAKKTKIKKYGSVWNLEAIKNKKFERYGDCNYNNPEKNFQTKKKNNTFKSSKPEEQAYVFLIENFGKVNVLRQHKTTQYPFACDFYLKNQKIYIECNFSWTHGGHIFDESDQNDIKKLNKWKAKGTKYYENAIETWTKRDVLKLKIALKNKINLKIFWSLDELKLWTLNFHKKVNNLY